MSASTEKKNRQAARAAGTDKKKLAAQEAAKKAAVSKRRWTIGTIAVVLLVVLILFFSSPLMYRITTAETIGSKSFSPAQVKFAMVSSNYSTYAAYFGEEYAQEMLNDNMIRTAALSQYAKENNITLTQQEKDFVVENLSMLSDVARGYGVSTSDYIARVYGAGVNKSVLREGTEEDILCGKVYNTKFCELSFTPEELAAYYEGLNGESDLFTYGLYFVAVDEERDDTTAKADAEAIVLGVTEGEEADTMTLLNDAVDHEFPGESATLNSSVTGSSLDADLKDWLMAERSEGDVTAIPASDGSGYSVVAFLGRDDNSETVAQVRHILIMAEADEEGNYTDEAKAAAKASAEEILAAWEAGEKTEADFATLANLYSDDSGSSSSGGLIMGIRPGDTVEEFDRFCFEDHNYGDTAIVYGEDDGYAGYHIIFYVGTDLGRNAVAKAGLANEAMNAWYEELTEGLEPVYHWAYRMVK